MSQDRIVVIGASAGGIDALLQIIRGLPRDFPAPICVVLHIPADSPSLLAHIFERHGVLPAKHAEEGERLQAGRIFIAPPDRHLIVKRDGTLRVARGARENRHRPAVDPLFRSAALAYGNRAIAVILSGALDDGTAGLRAIKQRGGVAIVQDPHDALYPSMPQNAMEHVAVDHCEPVARIAVLLTRLVAEEPPQARLEEAMWSAARTLEDSARLSARLAAAERRRGHEWLAQHYEEKERDARHRMDVIRRFLGDDDTSTPQRSSQRS